MQTPTDSRSAASGGSRSSRDARRTREWPALEPMLELARRAQQGNLDALRDLLYAYRERIRRVVAIRTGARLRAFLEAEELQRDTYLLALRKLGEEEPRDHASLLHWLTRIAESQVRSKFDYFAGRRREDELALRLSDATRGVTEINLTQSLSPRDRLRLEFERLIDGVVEDLDPGLREVVLLRDHMGMEWDEIARRLRLAGASTAQERYRRAHERVRVELRPYLERDRGTR